MGIFNKLFGKPSISAKTMEIIEEYEERAKQMQMDGTLNIPNSKMEENILAMESMFSQNKKHPMNLTLGIIYLYGINTYVYKSKAESILINFINEDIQLSRKAYLYLAILEGDLKGNVQQEVKYMMQAHNLGNMMATVDLGIYYAEGIKGLTRDLSKAEKLWKIAANNGIQEAQDNLDRLQKMVK
jgi:TPR repeat protein